MKNLKLILLIFILINKTSFALNDVYFTPSISCEDNIIEQINNAKTINIAVYSITNQRIADAIIQAKNKGTEIKIITDKLQSKGKNSKYLYLKEHGINIIVNTKFKIEHNKFAIFDNKLIETGSYNWTESASKFNSENCLFNDNVDIIEKYQSRFEMLWNIYNNN